MRKSAVVEGSRGFKASGMAMVVESLGVWSCCLSFTLRGRRERAWALGG